MPTVFDTIGITVRRALNKKADFLKFPAFIATPLTLKSQRFKFVTFTRQSVTDNQNGGLDTVFSFGFIFQMNLVTALLLLGVSTAVLGSSGQEQAHQGRKHRKNGGNRSKSTTTTTPATTVTPDEGVNADQPGETCEIARLKCAYRVGCGMALQVKQIRLYK